MAKEIVVVIWPTHKRKAAIRAKLRSKKQAG